MSTDFSEVVTFPLLKGKVLGGFAWSGKNMSTRSEFDTDHSAEANVAEFLDTLGLPKKIIQISSTAMGPKGIDSILEVTQQIYEEFVDNNIVLTPVEFMYTKDPQYTLMVKTADCSSCIVYATNKDDEKIVGVAHWGRKGVDDLNPSKMIRWLVDNEGCSLDSVYIGLAPSIGLKHHTLTKKEIFDDIPSKLPGRQNWDEFLVGPVEENGEALYHIDLLGRIKDMLVSEGVREDHIEIFGIDTYEAAAKGLTFSHRLSQVTGVKEGRMALGAALIQN